MTRIFDAWTEVHDRLEQAAWTSPVPTVRYGADQVTPDRHEVRVVGRLDGDDSTIEWATLGATQREERFALLLQVWAAEPGQTATDAKDALEAMVAVIEDALLPPLTTPTQRRDVGLGLGASARASIAAVRPIVEAGDEGAVGYCEIVIGVAVRLT